MAGNGTFAGISPEVFGQLVQSMQAGLTSAQPLAGYYQNRFTDLGLDTSAVSRLQQDYGWAQGQQSMLQYRYQLAAALNQPEGNFLNGMTTAGAGDLKFPTAQAAQQAGSKAAREYQDGQISLTQFLNMLGDDPDFDSGAFTVLGSSGLYQLQYDIHEQNDPVPDLKLLATAVAAAMSGGVNFPDEGTTWSGQQSFTLLAGLVRYASFPASVLVNLAEQADTSPETSASSRVEAIYAALAQNPVASAQFMAQFPRSHGGESFAQYISATGTYTSSYGQLFASIITAGTITARSIDPALAAQNVTSLVSFYAANPDTEPSPAIQMSFAKIISAYWTDVEAAVTDPSYPGATDGIGLNPQTAAAAWQAFTETAMQNPVASADLIQFSAQQAALLRTQNPGNDQAQFASGLIVGFFGLAAQTVYQQQLQASQAQAAGWSGAVQTQGGKIADLGVSIALDPETAGAATGAAIAQDVVEQIVSNIISSFGSIGPGTNLKPPDITTWQETLQQQAGTAWEKDNQLGDPAQYAQQFGCPPFLNQDGTLVSNATPAQQRAYNAWLKDPAVWSAIDTEFLNAETGQLGGLGGQQ